MGTNPEKAKGIASSLLGKSIKGAVVKTLLIEKKLGLKQQLYTSIAIDRTTKSLVTLASTSGGADIEEVAKVSLQNITRFSPGWLY